MSEAALRFDDRDNFDLEQYVASAFLSRRFGERFSAQLTVGGILDGTLEGRGRTFDVEPGFLAALSGGYRFLGGTGDGLFGTVTLTYGMSFASSKERGVADAESIPLRASDLRLGVLLGVTLERTINPYLGARLFGGPVAWELDGEERTGSDRHHYAIGPGIVVNLADRVDLTVDTSLVGERTAAAAVGFGF